MANYLFARHRSIRLDKLSHNLKFTALIGMLLLQPLLYAESTIEQSLGEFEYINNCAVCHGADGKGNGPMAEQLIKPPKDLTVLSKNNGGSFPETVVYQLIDGRRVSNSDEGRKVEPFHGPQDMPIWGDEFRTIEGDEDAVDERISNLIKYLRRIQVE
jgi:mono/diheme cytochrome c family protein